MGLISINSWDPPNLGSGGKGWSWSPEDKELRLPRHQNIHTCRTIAAEEKKKNGHPLAEMAYTTSKKSRPCFNVHTFGLQALG